NADKGDVVIGISFSGETPEVASILQLANENNINTISLTKYGHSIVAEQADINLYTSATQEPTFRSGATSSRMAQLQVIDILFKIKAMWLLGFHFLVKRLRWPVFCNWQMKIILIQLV